VVEALLAEGYRVTTVNRGLSRASYSGPVEHVTADRSAHAAYREALEGLAADCVVDVTAYGPEDTRPVLEAFRDRVSRFVHISTLSVYKPPFECPIPEDHALETDPENSYGFDKASCEALITAEATDALPWTILRLPAIFGPGDYFSREAYFLRSIMEGRQIITPSQPCLCQNIFAADAGRAVCSLLRSPRAVGRVYNAGNAPFVLEDYLELVSAFAGRAAVVARADREVLEQGGADLRRIPYFFEGDLWMDTGRIRTEAGFEPSAGIEAALALTLGAFMALPDYGDTGWWTLPWSRPAGNQAAGNAGYRGASGL
jgi:nucleoside-diphosphate-sugar epimerase